MLLSTTERSNLFFSADTHFSQERTRKLSRRPFADINAMDLAMVERWNSKVQPDDTVIHVGDFGHYPMVSKLNGNIILLAGNYERKDMKNGLISKDYLLGLGFKEVYLEEKSLTVSLEGTTVELVHEPSHAKTRHFKLFGHIHKLQMVKRNALNVGVDCHDFAPISLKEVFMLKEAIEKHFDNEVFMTL